jgi:hypothetical protein
LSGLLVKETAARAAVANATNDSMIGNIFMGISN